MFRPLCMLVAIAAVLSLAPVSTHAQATRDLTGDKLTVDNLVHTLTPKGPKPRGIGLAPPKCQHARGIELRPKADIARLQVEFDTNSANLTPQAEKTLDTLGQALNQAELKPCCFEVQGYTDSTGGAALNKKLSEQRAQSVIDYLSAHAGIDKDRMSPKGLGQKHPLGSNETAEGRQKNRRVQVVNLGYGELPK